LLVLVLFEVQLFREGKIVFIIIGWIIYVIDISGFVTRLTQRGHYIYILVGQELLTPPEHLRLPQYWVAQILVKFKCQFNWGLCNLVQVFSGVRVTRSLVLFVRLSVFFRPFCCLFFDLLILITSLWYLQAVLIVLRSPHNVGGNTMKKKISREYWACALCNCWLKYPFISCYCSLQTLWSLQYAHTMNVERTVGDG
jgi:hypothetical protein